MECWDELLDIWSCKWPKDVAMLYRFWGLPSHSGHLVSSDPYVRQQEARRTHELSDIDGKQTSSAVVAVPGWRLGEEGTRS